MSFNYFIQYTVMIQYYGDFGHIEFFQTCLIETKLSASVQKFLKSDDVINWTNRPIKFFPHIQLPPDHANKNPLGTL